MASRKKASALLVAGSACSIVLTSCLGDTPPPDEMLGVMYDADRQLVAVVKDCDEMPPASVSLENHLEDGRQDETNIPIWEPSRLPAQVSTWSLTDPERARSQGWEMVQSWDGTLDDELHYQLYVESYEDPDGSYGDWTITVLDFSLADLEDLEPGQILFSEPEARSFTDPDMTTWQQEAVVTSHREFLERPCPEDPRE
ncbi:hypothetical protein CLV92_10121 [Kineococcus xinjiangensis]|uniref:Uncharacterized protein n=1 Tax=Kineococcus xinjiangensis TaxID=512762 RepID=A0A2S6IVL8_9ACTN|nr:hypothetical protein [Kineococcus xinjiangensis]PPK98326.1 hypothetical protein CLV92_10121 [Kineococcus xinjiangensis]